MTGKLFTNPLVWLALALIVGTLAGLALLRHRSRNIHNGLLAGLAAGMVLLLFVIFKPAQTEKPQQLLAGSLSVPAYLAGGTPFQNHMRFTVKIEFTAEGRWSLSEYPDSISGPEGKTSSDLADGRYRMPGAPVSGLIMQRLSTSAFEYIGRSKIVQLEPNEQVLFLINDFKTEQAYSNNTGILKINWTCFDCMQ